MEEGQIQGKHLFPSSLYIHKKESLHVRRYSLPFCFVFYLQEEGKISRDTWQKRNNTNGDCVIFRAAASVVCAWGPELICSRALTCQGRLLHCCLSVHGNLTGFNSTCLCCDQGTKTEFSQSGWKKRPLSINTTRGRPFILIQHFQKAQVYEAFNAISGEVTPVALWPMYHILNGCIFYDIVFIILVNKKNNTSVCVLNVFSVTGKKKYGISCVVYVT